MPCEYCEAVMVATDDTLIERLLRVIDEGRRTGTYKLALLLDLVTRGIPFHVVHRSLDERVAQVRSILKGDEVVSVSRQGSLGPRLVEVTR